MKQVYFYSPLSVRLLEYKYIQHFLLGTWLVFLCICLYYGESSYTAISQSNEITPLLHLAPSRCSINDIIVAATLRVLSVCQVWC